MFAENYHSTSKDRSNIWWCPFLPAAVFSYCVSRCKVVTKNKRNKRYYLVWTERNGDSIHGMCISHRIPYSREQQGSEVAHSACSQLLITKPAMHHHSPCLFSALTMPAMHHHSPCQLADPLQLTPRRPLTLKLPSRRRLHCVQI